MTKEEFEAEIAKAKALRVQARVIERDAQAAYLASDAEYIIGQRVQVTRGQWGRESRETLVGTIVGKEISFDMLRYVFAPDTKSGVPSKLTEPLTRFEKVKLI